MPTTAHAPAPGLRVAAIELPARFGAPDRQLALARDLLLAAPPPDLALLPEASLTGYVSPGRDFDLRGFAEELAGPTSRALADLAREAGCAVVGPLVERAGHRFFNAMVGFDARGERFLHYRKRHPWYVEDWADPGDGPFPRASLQGRTFAIAICFDIHFLEDERALEAGETLLFPSAWVAEEDLRPAQLSGLAERRGVSIVNANWGPGDPRVPGQGGSAIYEASGRAVGQEAVAIGGGRRVDAELAGRTK